LLRWQKKAARRELSSKKAIDQKAMLSAPRDMGMAPSFRIRRGARLFALALIVSSIIAVVGCGDDEPAYGDSACRFDPASCAGGPGGMCRTSADCQGGFCCTENANCGGGMCTFACRADIDCPPAMACEHDMCFYACRSTFDCASGQRCEHGNTVCEWPG
jgi:hypothetical protein